MNKFLSIMRHLLLSLITVSSIHASTPADQSEPAATIRAAKGVLTRVMGGDAVSRMRIALLPQVDGRDVYEYEATASTLTTRGSSAVAVCRGAYDFLRARNMGTVGWAGARLEVWVKP